MSLGERTPAGDWLEDPTEQYTVEELCAAFRLRERVVPNFNLRRRDGCPHSRPCKTELECVRHIAWFLRYRAEILAAEP